MLLTMKSLTQACRMLCFATARSLDIAQRSNDAGAKLDAMDRAALLTPLAKAFSTDIGVEVASLGIQVHGGMGFVEETGAAQHYRDARILPIYEGTNGIQAIDLVTRKLPIDGGEVVNAYLRELYGIGQNVRHANRADLGMSGDRLTAALKALQSATAWMGRALQSDPESALAGATPYLRLFSLVAGGSYMLKGALSETANSPRVALARFYAENILPQSLGLADAVTGGAQSVLVDPHGAVFA
jgi:hypothetical protein